MPRQRAGPALGPEQPGDRHRIGGAMSSRFGTVGARPEPHPLSCLRRRAQAQRRCLVSELPPPPGRSDSSVVGAGFGALGGQPIPRQQYILYVTVADAMRVRDTGPAAEGTRPSSPPKTAAPKCRRGRPFTTGPATSLISRGIGFASATLHTGVTSPEADEPPHPERFNVGSTPPRPSTPPNHRRTRHHRRNDGGSCIGERPRPRPRTPHWEGATSLVVKPDRGVHVIDGVLSGLYEPRCTQLAVLSHHRGPAPLSRLIDTPSRPAIRGTNSATYTSSSNRLRPPR